MAKVLWKANSSRHDWREGAPLVRLLAAAGRLGLTGAVSWIRPDADRDPEPAAIPAGPGLPERLRAAARPRGGIIDFAAGGEDPAPWEVFWNVYRYDAQEAAVSGINTLWLTFERQRVGGSERSRQLLAEFFDLHRPEDTEYAVLHPYDHWIDLADLHYEVPVTITPMFQGAFWANFLGLGHLGEFDLDRLAGFASHEVRWLERDGVFFVTAPDLDRADGAEAEAEMLRVTELFRQALRPDSKWHL